MKLRFDKKDMDDQFRTAAKEIYQTVVSNFTTRAEELVLRPEWKDDLNRVSDQLEHQLQKTFDAWRTKQIEKLFKITRKNMGYELEGPITEPIQELQSNLWEEVEERYRRCVADGLEVFKEILANGFRPPEDEYNGYVQEIEEQIHEDTEKLIIHTCRDLGSHLNRRF
jgi:hypothetical protein